MTQPTARFCVTCGEQFADQARFCRSCGTPRTATPTQERGDSVAATGGAMRTAQTAAAYAGRAGALPWQTVVAGQAPDLGALLSHAGLPLRTNIVQTVVRRSVRKPALAMLFTTLLDTLIALISGQPAAVSALVMRFVTGSGTGFLGLIVGKRAGFGRSLVGIGSGVTAALQLYSVGSMLLASLQADAGFLSMLPSLVSTVSVIVVAVKMLLMAFRRQNR